MNPVSLYGTLTKKLAPLATGAVIFFNPIGAGIESAIGLSWDVSLKSRVVTTSTTYLLLPAVIEGRILYYARKGVDLSDTNITITSTDRKIAGIASLVIRPIVYLSAGETDWKKIAFGSVATAAVSAALGPKVLRILDKYLVDPASIVPERAKQWAENTGVHTRHTLNAVLIAGSILATSGVIAHNYLSHQQANAVEPSRLEQIAVEH
ncbi:MAG: hypothetical protein ABIA93_03940 [Candidatus Woesearchaeota archaeon]